MSTKGGSTEYLIRGNLTDEMLISILKKELPGALNRMNINKSQIDMTIDDLAYYLANYAKSCNQSDYLRDLNLLKLKQPSIEQCKDFKEFLDQIVQIRIVSKDYKTNNHLIKNMIGKIWSYFIDEEAEKKGGKMKIEIHQTQL